MYLFQGKKIRVIFARSALECGYASASGSWFKSLEWAALVVYVYLEDGVMNASYSCVLVVIFLPGVKSFYTNNSPHNIFLLICVLAPPPIFCWWVEWGGGVFIICIEEFTVPPASSYGFDGSLDLQPLTAAFPSHRIPYWGRLDDMLWQFSPLLSAESARFSHNKGSKINTVALWRGEDKMERGGNVYKTPAPKSSPTRAECSSFCWRYRWL